MAKALRQLHDKFYTKKNIVVGCLSLLGNLGRFKTIIEPSAGNGSFSSELPGCLAFDIEPENPTITKQDFLKLSGLECLERPILVVGNPPFGRQSSLALQFIKKSCVFADTIAFILPKSFKKQSVIDKIPTNFHLEHQWDLPKGSFLLNGSDYDVPCVFQIWKNLGVARVVMVSRSPDGFMFVKKHEHPDFAFRRVGVYAGRVSWDYESKSVQSHYFIKATYMEPLKLYSLMDSIIWEHDNTSGPRSISKQELIIELDNSAIV